MLICWCVIDFSLGIHVLLCHFIFFHCFNRLLSRVNRLHCVAMWLSIYKIFGFNQLTHGLIDYHLCICGVMVQSVVLIDYCIILIDYVLGLKLFLSLCYVVIDYGFILIDYMLWCMASLGLGIVAVLRRSLCYLFSSFFIFSSLINHHLNLHWLT